MNRRTLLSIAPLLTGISGCIDRSENTDTSEENAQSDRDNESTTKEDGYSWQAGTSLVMVDVNEDFSGEVILEADCRGEKFNIESGDEFGLDRKEDGESCSFRLLLDGEEVYDAGVSGASRYSLLVEKDGEITEDGIEVI
ncbi:hypothetical protein [Natronococcus pandeyae]|uniref:hypothetical protein n=1 Tax=Natronococcus pandeyae TaxID=2055836 RepID=UPI0011E89BD3|nr:hypothetical protein [Natronococcus pandeyae]